MSFNDYPNARKMMEKAFPANFSTQPRPIAPFVPAVPLATLYAKLGIALQGHTIQQVLLAISDMLVQMTPYQPQLTEPIPHPLQRGFDLCDYLVDEENWSVEATLAILAGMVARVVGTIQAQQGLQP